MRVTVALTFAAILAAVVAASPDMKMVKRVASSTSEAAKKTSKYFVSGKSIPGVPFTVPDSYAGLLPISSKKKESRELFFWWYPAENKVGKDDLTIWLNGGPGCSSLEGLLQENGPWLLPWNSDGAVANPYSWTKLSNVLWIEQPVGVGLGKGAPDITNESQLAEEFYGFLVEFFKTFPQLKGKKLWLTGESYAGKYIPYIADHIVSKVSKGTNKKNGINYQGFGINDPSFVSSLVGEELPSVEFATVHQQTLGLNDSFIAHLQQEANKTGIANYAATHLNYPPKGKIPIPQSFLDSPFDPFDELITAATDVNPCFNIYNIEYKCPSVKDPLGFPPDAVNPSSDNFVNNVDGFKKYIHADPNTTWYECTINPVFKGAQGDRSKAPADTKILQRVIEAGPARRNVIQHGLLDAVLMANGSALGIQNTTWNGKQGFQRPPKQQLIVDGQNSGVVQSERGLTFVRIDNSGHMVPQDQPKVAYKLQQYLLGQISLKDLYN